MYTGVIGFRCCLTNCIGKILKSQCIKSQRSPTSFAFNLDYIATYMGLYRPPGHRTCDSITQSMMNVKKPTDSGFYIERKKT